MLATDFRKNLYQNLDQVAKGEPLMIEYKGTTLRLQAVNGVSKLSRAVRRNTIVGDPNAIIGSDPELMAMLEAKWAEDNKQL